ncbi:helix-turn-helix domain-containing protein [Dyella sp.]|uniref:TetR/AcrR family transcriptional regulator n=1 Tax=Dyella sp. TaxID=1869338 RepID=UPI002ED27529
MKTSLDNIISEARELFRVHGYAGASMQDLATRVGIKKPSLYTRFPTKESLVPEVLALTSREMDAALPDASGDWLARYEAVLRAMAADLVARQRCVCLHLAYDVGDDTPEAADAVRSYFRQQRDAMAAMLGAAFDAQTARAMAMDALARIEGATLWTVIDSDPAPMWRAVDELVEIARSRKGNP